MVAAKATLSLEKAFDQVLAKLIGWANYTITMLPNLLVAAIILAAVWKMGTMTEKLVNRAFLRLFRQRHVHVARLVAMMGRMGVLVAGIILALNVLHLDKAVASLLAGIGILGIAFGFASKDIVANFMAGILLHMVHPFRMGDLIKSGEFFGYLESMDLRFTTIRSKQGQRITIPNQTFLASPITNFTITGIRRVDLDWSLTQVEDLQRAEKLAIKAVESLELRNPDRPVELFYEKVGDYTIDFKIRFWTEPEQTTFLKARSDAIKAIKLTFEKHGIPMPSPVRVLDFGIVGGKSLREQLEGLRLPLALPEAKPGEKAGNAEPGAKKTGRERGSPEA